MRVLATLALLVCQDQSQVSQNYRSPAFSFPLPDPSMAVSEAANGQVYFFELRRAGQDASAPFLKLFSVPDQQGAVDVATLGESIILDSQPSEAETLARNFCGSVIRQNPLMSLTDEQLHVGQRDLLQLADGSQAEIRNAIFSNESVELCFLTTLYATGNRPGMVAWMDRMLAEVAMP